MHFIIFAAGVLARRFRVGAVRAEESLEERFEGWEGTGDDTCVAFRAGIWLIWGFRMVDVLDSLHDPNCEVCKVPEEVAGAAIAG